MFFDEEGADVLARANLCIEPITKRLKRKLRWLVFRTNLPKNAHSILLHFKC
jgi:hypothetical protein